jgi:hypothetical protein
VKNLSYSPHKAILSYYRDSNAKEIDIIVEQGNLVHPLEVKKSANPNRREVKKFDVLGKSSIKQGCGGIICMCQETIPIDDKNCFIPCNIL